MAPDEPPDDAKILTVEEALKAMDGNPLRIANILAIASGESKGDMIAMDEPDRANRFTVDPSGVVVCQCLYCDQYTIPFHGVCRAFPSVVPLEILANEFDHRKPHEGDQGFQFKPRDGVTEDDLTALYANLDLL
jgi:hypothetical protein